MMRTKQILILILITTVIFSCRRDVNSDIKDTKTTKIELKNKKVTASLFAQVRNESGDFIEGAIATLGTEVRTSNEDGMVYFKDVTMNGFGTYITFQKDDFFLGAKMINPTNGNTAYTYVTMLQKKSLGTISASTGGTLETAEGAMVTLPAGGIKDESGRVYDGDVLVYGKWLDPTSDVVEYTMPGDLRAVDGVGEIKQLTTYGMMAVELKSPSGKVLQIADSHTAKLEMPIPTGLMSSATESIPLWYFDEIKGYWIEEGEAKLVDGSYVGDVNHFSFWNCDLPGNTVYIRGSVVDPSGKPVVGTMVRIVRGIDGFSRRSAYGRTDNMGLFQGNIPSNENLSIIVSGLICGHAPLFTAAIGPFSEAVALAPIVIASSPEQFSLSANWINCNNLAVSNGYAKLEVHDQIYYYPFAANGGISATIFSCQGFTTASITGYDLDNSKQQDSVFTVTPTVDLGTIKLCEELVEFIKININGNEVSIPNPSMNSNGGKMTLAGLRNLSSPRRSYTCTIAFPSTVAGSYAPDNFSANIVTPSTSLGISCQPSQSACSVSATHTGIVALGDTVRGIFSGMVLDGSDTISISGSFKVIME